MIRKLKERIFLVVMLSLSIVMVGIIISYAYLNYNNTITAAVSMMNRFIEPNPLRNSFILEDFIIKPEFTNINGLCRIIILDSTIVHASGNLKSNEISKFSNTILKRNSKNGIIDDYIYEVKKFDKNIIIISLLENKNTISNIKTMFLFSGIMVVFSVIIVFIIAKKLSIFIVKPVEETFEKQKEFISDASHELKTPLAVIEANTDVLQDKVGENKWINYIQTEIESMNKLINELLLLTKIENVDNVKEYVELDVSKEVEILLSMFESVAYEKGVIIENNITENIFLNGNKQDLEHIVSTLTDNAIKHTESGNKVIVNLKKEKSQFILEVKNMGDPIPSEEKEKIFERFYRIDKSRNRNEKRYGLGLSIAKATIEKYHGKIAVDYKDGFTIFKVAIPI